MPINTYRASNEIVYPNDPEVRELLDELNIPDLFINEVKIYKYSNWFGRTKQKLIETRYEVLWKLDNTEYQIITAVSTLRQVLIYLYGLYAGLKYDKRKITRYRRTKH